MGAGDFDQNDLENLSEHLTIKVRSSHIFPYVNYSNNRVHAQN